MRPKSHAPRQSGQLTSIVLTMTCLAVLSFALPARRAEAGSLVIPAWSFARGNARCFADPMVCRTNGV